MKKIIALLCALVLVAATLVGVTNVRSANKINALNADLTALQETVDEGHKTIDTLSADVADKTLQIETLSAEVAEKEAQIEALTADVGTRDEEIALLSAEVAEKTAEIEALSAAVTTNTTEIERLSNELADAQRVLQVIADMVNGDDAQPATAETTDLPETGDVVNGFEAKNVRRFDLLNADLVLFEHQKTGAQVLLLANEDTNRVFDITFRTPTLNDKGVPHVFEHSTLDGSEKYPSKALFFNLSYQTYNTYMNAATYNMMTTYPVASLSEAQLLKYADYYVDSCFHPMLYNDPSIIEEEAWRYALSSPEDDLTLAGTVYSEMQGAYTINSAASFHFNKTLFPGSTVGNIHGGDPAHIPEMTHDELIAYHQTYYHPSNSLTCLYGSFNDYAAFLQLLDQTFSAYDKKEFVIEDSLYTPLTEAVEKSFEFGVESTSDTANGAIVYYGFMCGEADTDTLNKLDMLTTLLNSDASAVMQNLKTALPSASAGCYVELTAPEAAIVFYASGLNAQDAPTFRDTINASLAQIAQDGFDLSDVDAIIASTQLDIKLIGESNSIGVNMLPNIAYYWAGTGNLYGYMDFVDSLDHFGEYAADGTLTDLLSAHLIDNPRTALVTTTPVAGLKEQQDAALQQQLAEIKAGMSEEEIAAIVEKTAALAAPEADDASQYVAQLQAVTVDTLPEEARIYEISDTVNENGIRVINALADADGVGMTLMLLDASGLEQDQLHYFKLYTQLLGELDTDAHTRGELASLITRYLYNANIRVSVLDHAEDDGYTPYLRVSFEALDEDMQDAYDLVNELLFDSKLDDVQRLKDRVTALKTGLKSSITAQPFYIPLYRAFAADSGAMAYYNYVTYLDYYAFLEQLEAQLEADPEAVVADLTAVRDCLKNRTNAVIGFSGSAESAANHQAVAEAFLANLDQAEIEPKTYEFPMMADSEALVVDSAVNYNLLYANYETMGMEDYSGALDAVTALVSDSFLYPLLRDQYGAYSVMHGASDTGVYILSYRDPNVKETFAVYQQLSDLVAGLGELDQETLDGYILSSYSAYAQSAGEISGGMSAVLTTLEGESQEKVLDYMHQLKGITADSVAQYADMYRLLAENGKLATVGAASTINANAELYSQVLNPFGVGDKTEVTLSDVTEADWYYDAVRYVFESGIMAPVAEDRFGALDDTAMGELSAGFCKIIGVTDDPQEAIDFLASYGILTPDTAIDETLTREDLIVCSYYFVASIGVEPAAAELGDYPDADTVNADLAGILAWLLDQGIMAPHDGELKLAQNASRADAACLLAAIGNMLQ